MLSLVTVASVPDHRCFVPELDSVNGNATIWDAEQLYQYIPRSSDGSIDSCSMYVDNFTEAPCEKYVYDTTYYKSSRTMEWNFVCDRRWMGAIAQVS